MLYLALISFYLPFLFPLCFQGVFYLYCCSFSQFFCHDNGWMHKSCKLKNWLFHNLFYISPLFSTPPKKKERGKIQTKWLIRHIHNTTNALFWLQSTSLPLLLSCSTEILHLHLQTVAAARKNVLFSHYLFLRHCSDRFSCKTVQSTINTANSLCHFRKIGKVLSKSIHCISLLLWNPAAEQCKQQQAFTRANPAWPSCCTL